MFFLEKQQHGQVLGELLVETAAHDWADLGNARTMGEEIHATYHREMESTWGPDHITTVPEDYAQHVILGVCLVNLAEFQCLFLIPFFRLLSILHDISLSQALRLLWLATHLESRDLDLKCEALESLSIGGGGTKAAAIWDVIAGAFAPRSEPVIRSYADYCGATPSEDPFDAVNPAPAIGRPLGFDVASAPEYKPVDHIEAALHRMQIGVDPVTSSQGLNPLLIPNDPINPATRSKIKATVAQQPRAVRKLPACISLAEATIAYPARKEKTSATGIPLKYLSKRLTALSPNDSLYACTFEGCDRIFKQLAGAYNHLCCLHLRVAVGCYYCSGRWWTSKGWSDHHIWEHPHSDPYPSGATLEWLLVKKAQVQTLAESEDVSSASH